MPRGPTLTFFLVLTVVLAGCGATIPAPTPVETEESGDRDREGTEFEVTVTEVIDGDTITVAFSDGTVENVRLLGVDTPEVHADTQPDEFEGIPGTEAGLDHLRTWGERATDFAKSRLEPGETVRIVVDETADRRGSYGRLLVYLYEDGTLFNRLLLEEGYARLYDTRFRERSAFANAETTARENGVGLWGFGEETKTRHTTRSEVQSIRSRTSLGACPAFRAPVPPQ